MATSFQLWISGFLIFTLVACSNHKAENNPQAPDPRSPEVRFLSAKYKKADFHCQLWNQFGREFDSTKAPDDQFRVNLLTEFPTGKSRVLESTMNDDQVLVVVIQLQSLRIQDLQFSDNTTSQFYILKNSPVVSYSFNGHSMYRVLEKQYATNSFGNSYQEVRQSREKINDVPVQFKTGLLENFSHRFFLVQCSIETEANPGFESEFEVTGN